MVCYCNYHIFCAAIKLHLCLATSKTTSCKKKGLFNLGFTSHPCSVAQWTLLQRRRVEQNSRIFSKTARWCARLQIKTARPVAMLR